MTPSTNLQQTLGRALAYANERHHEDATLEHLLLSLTEDQDSAAVLRGCTVDLDKLRRDLLNYVDNDLASLFSSHVEDAKPTASFQRVLQRAAIHVQSSGREEVTGANVLVAMFAERESHAVYFLQEQEMTRFDAVNYISLGIAKTPGPTEAHLFTAKYSPKYSPIDTLAKSDATFKKDWEKIENLTGGDKHSFVKADNGIIDLTINSSINKELNSRIGAAESAIETLIRLCRKGNQQHSDLANFADEYKLQLGNLTSDSSGIIWYVVAQKIEIYRSNYIALSKIKSSEYPPLDASMSTIIDTVVISTAIIARLFPEIAECQDDVEKYAVKQIGVRSATRKLLDGALSDLAHSDGVLTPRASAIAEKIAVLDPGATPEDAPEMVRAVATKSNFLRDFLGAIAKESLKFAQRQAAYLEQNIKTKAFYDLSKEIVKSLVENGYSRALEYISNIHRSLITLSETWPSMFDFVPALLRILGLI
jgi:Clp amino terminal domain, pathogenicity island component